MVLHKQYFKLENGKEIKFSILYIKGTGYRVSSYPVKRTKTGGFCMEEFEAYSGFLDTLVECNRSSAGRLKEAIQKLQDNIKNYFDWYRENYGWSVETVVETTYDKDK